MTYYTVYVKVSQPADDTMHASYKPCCILGNSYNNYVLPCAALFLDSITTIHPLRDHENFLCFPFVSLAFSLRKEIRWDIGFRAR